MTQSKSYATAAAALLLGLILLLSPSTTNAFAPSSSTVSRAAYHPAAAARRAVVVFATNDSADADAAAAAVAAVGGGGSSSSRRDVLARTLAAAMTASGTAFLGPFAASAAAASPAGTVVVAGATGQTGRRILERLAASSSPSVTVVAGVRDVNRAKKSLSESSTVVRVAMVQKVESVSAGAGLELRHLDVATDTVDELAKTLAGATYLVIAVGFVPGNPLRMNAAAHEVDNVGTCKLIVSVDFFLLPVSRRRRPFAVLVGCLGRLWGTSCGGAECFLF
jgi:hypothetical protein